MNRSLFILLFIAPLVLKGHYGPNYTPPATSAPLRTLSTSSTHSNTASPYDYLLKNSEGIPSRWVKADSGSKIKFYIDWEFLPGSFSTLQCKNAAKEAFDKWTEITGISFLFGGFLQTKESWSDFFENNKGFEDSIVIYMHETYDSHPNENYLAAAEAHIYNGTESLSGGKFKGTEFTKRFKGFIYFNHDHTHWDDATYESLVSTMAHEIGHVLGLRHSNYDPSTGEEIHMPIVTDENRYQRESIMYYQKYDGKDFGQWDIDHIKLLYDKENHVPFSNSEYSNEFIYVPYNPYYSEDNINCFTFDIGDLDNDTLSIIELSEFGYKYPHIENYLNNKCLELRYTNAISPGEWLTKTNSDWHRFSYRVQDTSGNMSPIYHVKIKKLIVDNNTNGISDEWESSYGVSPPSRNFDTDGDMVSDYNEYLTDTDPTNGDSFDSTLRQLGLAENERDNLYSLQDMADLRLGSSMIQISNNQATIQLQMEESSDLQTWEDIGTPATMTLPADSDTKFFRFKMAE